uniref:Uncharacterized protein n=1 Tax=Avena sativa TaxID=4498 RepID=A0ACD5W4E8_AVESA
MAAQEASQPLRFRYGDVEADGSFSARGVPVLAALLGILVCFVCVCLYLRWACRRYSPDPTLPSYSSSASAPGAASSVVGLDAAAVAGLPVTLYRRPPAPEGDADAAQCPICLGEFEDGEEVKALPPCGHRFHPECVDVWLLSRPSCPLCRGSLLPDTANKTDAGSEVV